jgi:uncharacterized iron-regulated membrane protein
MDDWRMKFSLSPALVKRYLRSHSWMGLAMAAMLYLVCLSGTVVVFAGYLDRWEQPDAQEFTEMDTAVLDEVYRDLVEQAPELSGDVLIMLPREGIPRASLVSSEGAWLLNQDGSRGADMASPWTDMLISLHDHLHLPGTWGLVVVSITGVLMTGLIVSGFLSHPSIFKDAFHFRRGASPRLQQTDLHNRLSVWAAPFHLMIALTGAYFGVALLINFIVSSAFFAGNDDAVLAEVFGGPPVLEQEVAPVSISRALTRLQEIAPAANPFYVTIEDANSPEQYMLIGAHHTDRLIYAEQYRFDQAGEYIDNVGYTDGPVGRQALFSVFRVHFGHFGGLPVLFLYGFLGIALSVVCVSGVNIWLNKRKQRDIINVVWPGFVWGAPVAIVASALLSLLTGMGATIGFWVILLACVCSALSFKEPAATRKWLLTAVATLAWLLVLAHIWVYGDDALQGVALTLNVSLLVLASGLIAGLFARQRQ